MKNIISFTKETIEKITPPELNRKEFKDSKIPELRLRVTSNGVKSYSVFKRVNGGSGKPVRITIGKFPSLSPSKAKVEAQKLIGLLAEGINPKERKAVNSLENIRLQEAFEWYLSSKSLKQNTLNDYHSLMRCQLSVLATKKLSRIKSEEISRLHSKCSESSKSRADYAFRLLRAIYNFISIESVGISGKSLFIENPVRIISGRKQWNNVSRKQGHIRKSELHLFAKALKEVREESTVTGESVCDALLFALLTGLRKSEVLNIKWTDINLAGRYFTVRDTKNGNPLELPLTSYLENILEFRKISLLTDYVFSAENTFGQVRTPWKVVQKLKTLSRIDCDFHDLRRTFATTAEHLDVGTYKLKRLMNHRTNRNDVTAGYVILTAETLRSTAEKIQLELIENMSVN
jgi:integrase